MAVTFRLGQFLSFFLVGLTLFRAPFCFILSPFFRKESLLYACNYIAPEPLKSQRPPSPSSSSLFSFDFFYVQKERSIHR